MLKTLIRIFSVLIIFVSATASGYVRGQVYGGCYQQKDAGFNAVYGGFMAWPITSCPPAGMAFPTCAPGFALVVLSSSQANSATSPSGFNFLNMDVYFTSWACAKL